MGELDLKGGLSPRSLLVCPSRYPPPAEKPDPATRFCGRWQRCDRPGEGGCGSRLRGALSASPGSLEAASHQRMCLTLVSYLIAEKNALVPLVPSSQGDLARMHVALKIAEEGGEGGHPPSSTRCACHMLPWPAP